MLVFIIIVSLFTNDFCDGYEKGYRDGYCYELEHNGIGCIEPITPVCPLPEGAEFSYEHGYERGFLDGVEDYE